MGLTRWVNNLFKSCSVVEEFYDYGLYTPEARVRKPPDAPPSSSSSTSASECSSKVRARQAEIARKEEERKREEAKKEMEKKAKEFENKFTAKTGGKPTMTVEQAYNFALECGFAPRASEFLEFEAANPGGITIAKYMEAMAQFGNVTESEDELLILFKKYDHQNKGKLSKAQFINLMTSFGEPLTLEEVQFLLTDLGLDADPVDYVKFVKELMVPPS